MANDSSLGGLRLSPNPWEVSASDGQAEAVNWTVKGQMKVGGKFYLYDATKATFQEVKLLDDGSGHRLLYVDV